MRFLIVSILLSCWVHCVHAQRTHTTLFGHNDALLYGRYWADSEKGRQGKSKEQLRPDVYQICKAYPRLLSTDLDGLELGRTKYWGGVTFEQMRNAILLQHHNGGLVTISWHVRNPEHGTSYIYNEKNKGTVKRILQRDGKTYETFSLYLKRIADFLLTLRDSDGKLIPILFRPFHECNGHWFWWGTADCSEEEYVDLWRMTHQYLTERGLTNLKYVFSPDSWFKDEKEYLSRFPGEQYVDVIGIECYRPKGFEIEESRTKFYSHLQKNLKIAKSIADDLGVPYALTETGMQPNSDAQWWTKGLMPALEGYNPLFVNVWSNQWEVIVPEGGTWCTYPGEISAKDFKKFYKQNKKMFIKKLLPYTSN